MVDTYDLILSKLGLMLFTFLKKTCDTFNHLERNQILTLTTWTERSICVTFKLLYLEVKNTFPTWYHKTGYHLVPTFSICSKFYSKASAFETISSQNLTNVNVKD